MKLTVLSVGRQRDAWIREGCEEYLCRLRVKLPTELVEVKDDDELLRRLPPRASVWALDERGEELSSAELAARLKRAMNGGAQGIAFAIGGADGLSAAIRQRAGFTWSLGRLTLPHRLARLIVVEQLYRALSILRGEPYHRP